MYSCPAFFQNDGLIREFATFCALMVLGMATLSSCAPQRPKYTEQIENLRARAEALIKAQSLMAYENWTFGKESNQDSLYKANASLFTVDTISLVTRAEKEEPDTVQKKRLRYFRRYLVTEHIAKETAPLTDWINNYEATATVAFDGKQILYREVPILLANANSQSRRRALYASLDPILDTLNHKLVEVETVRRRMAKDLGYSSFNSMIEELNNISLDEIREAAQQILAATDSTYTTLLAENLAGELKLTRDNFYWYDVARLFRNRQFDRYFPETSLMDVLKKSYRGLGIDIDAQKNLTIDAEQREKKNRRAVCYAIDVPNDIRLSIKPIGGIDDYAALFHEMGHGQHYANTKEHAFEFKYLNEPTVTECYAFLSEYLLANQAWLRLYSTMPIPVLKDLVRFQAFHRVYYVRRYAAKVVYEIALHSGESDLPALYARLMKRAIGCVNFRSDEKRYLIDVDENFYSAAYLRAWFLEAQLNAKLTNDFGPNWFEHPQAGDYLRSLWAKGDSFNGNELAHVIGYETIAADLLLAEIDRMILFSTKQMATRKQSSP